MNSTKLGKLLKQYEKCPDCGSNKVNTKDAIRVGADTLTRSCECGFKITVNEDGQEI